MKSLSTHAQARWLDEFATLMERNPDARLSYTTSDDGVWLSFGPGDGDEINIGFTREAAGNNCRSQAKAMRRRKS